MAQLPAVGEANWGLTLNDFLQVAHNGDGSTKGQPADSHSLASGVSAGATSIILDRSPLFGTNSGFVIIDPFTLEAEIRRISTVSGAAVTVTALTYAHAANDRVIYFPGGLVPWPLFGAKPGNTSYASDNVTAFNRLSQQLYNLGTFYHGGILIPQGLWYIDNELTPERDQVIAGESVISTKIVAHTTFPFTADGSVAMIHPKRDGTPVNYGIAGVSSRWILRNLWLDGASITNSNGILSSPQQPDAWENIRVDGCKGYAISLGDVQQHVMRNIELINNGTGLDLFGTRFLFCYDLNIEQTDLGGYGVRMRKGQNETGSGCFSNHFIGVHIEEDADFTAFYLENSDCLYVTDAWVGIGDGSVGFHFAQASGFEANNQACTYVLQGIRSNTPVAGAVMIDDDARGWTLSAEEARRWIPLIIGTGSNIPSATNPRGNHGIYIPGRSGRDIRIGASESASGFKVANIDSKTVDANQRHVVGRDGSAETWAVDHAGQGMFESLRVKAAGPTISQGTGTPEGVVTAPVGSLFLRTDAATSLYVKQTGTGNTGWVVK